MSLVKWFLLIVCMTTFLAAENAPAALNIVPRPATVRHSMGSFLLTNRTRIVATDAESRRIAGLFNQFLLDHHGMRLKLAAGIAAGDNVILFTQQASRGLPPEGCRCGLRRRVMPSYWALLLQSSPCR